MIGSEQREGGTKQGKDYVKKQNENKTSEKCTKRRWTAGRFCTLCF